MFAFMTPLIATILVITGAAKAEEKLDSFFGTYHGTGFTEESAESGKRNTQRKFEMRILPYRENGFSLITWTTGTKNGGEPNGDKLWTSKASYLPSGHEGVYHALGSANPLEGRLLSWARIADETLIVYRIAIDSTGIPEFQIFRRTVNAEGLDLSFRALRDGKQVRAVRGSYTRQ